MSTGRCGSARFQPESELHSDYVCLRLLCRSVYEGQAQLTRIVLWLCGLELSNSHHYYYYYYYYYYYCHGTFKDGTP